MEVEYKLVCMFLTQLKLNTLSDLRNNGMIVSKNVSQTIWSRFRFKATLVNSVGMIVCSRTYVITIEQGLLPVDTTGSTTRSRSDLRLQS